MQTMNLAIITGASVGIGKASAQQFIERDFAVYNLSRRACSVPGVHNICCDLSDDHDVHQAGEQLRAAAERATTVALVHNACQMRKDSADNCKSDSLRAVLETNLVAINSLNQLLLPVIKTGSSVIYVGSTLSEKAVPGSFSYVVSKHALAGMMKASCQDLMGSGIHTALICPGFTDTEMLRTHLGDDPDALASVAGLNSFGRLIEPEEIADLIVWAHHNPVINGGIMHANLGQREA